MFNTDLPMAAKLFLVTASSRWRHAIALDYEKSDTLPVGSKVAHLAEQGSVRDRGGRSIRWAMGLPESL